MQSLKTILITIVTLHSLAHCASADDAHAVARKTLPSVVFILVVDANDQPVSSRSGFFIKPGTIATNWHFVSGATKIKFSLVRLPAWYGAILKAHDSEHVVALLKVVDDVQVASLRLGDSSGVEVGRKIYAVGNP